MRVVYLHGFASSPQSSKARFFGSKFAEAGVAFNAPQLDQGEFRDLTISGQMVVVGNAVSAHREKLAKHEPLVLMGSSLGGYLAALYAQRHPKAVDRLVLLAPAFEFLRRWRARLSIDEMENWKKEGSIPIYHYGSNTEQRLGYGFLEDAAQYESAPDFHQRALILHGTDDKVVPSQVSHDFALEHTRVRLALFKSGHELTDVLEGLWQEVSGFLEIHGPGVV
jgi:pimeloyl-ACP methyl ester carboxylesterase